MKDPAFRSGGRLVMLGTPNHGSFVIPQVITGLEGMVKKLSLLDLRHKADELLNVFNSFVGSYQMMPSYLVMPEVKFLYNASTYSRFKVTVSQTHLNNAYAHHKLLQDVVDPDRMIYIAGYDQPTFSGIKDKNNLDKIPLGEIPLNKIAGYEMTLDGDGRVPHKLGFLDKDGKKMFPTYFIQEEHGNLSSNPRILTALDALLETGKTDDLFDNRTEARKFTIRRGMRDGRPPKTPEEESEALKKLFETLQKEEEVQLQTSLRGISNGRRVRLTYTPDVETASANRSTPEEETHTCISPEERKVEEIITRGFLSYHADEVGGEDDEDKDKIRTN
jgi:hypothetical protein